MADSLSFEMVTPLGIHQGENVKEIVLPAESGEMGVLPGHDIMIVQLGMGAVQVKYDDKTDIFFCCRGYIEINNDHVRVIAEISEKREEIDVDRAEQAKNRAESRLKDTTDKVDWTRAESALQRAIHRVTIAKVQ